MEETLVGVILIIHSTQVSDKIIRIGPAKAKKLFIYHIMTTDDSEMRQVDTFPQSRWLRCPTPSDADLVHTRGCTLQQSCTPMPDDDEFFAMFVSSLQWFALTQLSLLGWLTRPVSVFIFWLVARKTPPIVGSLASKHIFCIIKWELLILVGQQILDKSQIRMVGRSLKTINSFELWYFSILVENIKQG